MPWNWNDAFRRQAAQRAQEQQQRFRQSNQQRVAKQMNDLMAQWRLRRSARQQQQQRVSQQPDAAGVYDGGGAGLGPLTPEPPISEPQGEPSMREAMPGPAAASSPGSPPRPQPAEPGEIRGTVLNVVQPVVNVNPWLTMDIRTESGETVAVRKFFFWGAVTAPFIAEGHYVRVAGRRTRGGYIKPRYIVNETTGSRWN
jgi:hypothetical protein